MMPLDLRRNELRAIMEEAESGGFRLINPSAGPGPGARFHPAEMPAACDVSWQPGSPPGRMRRTRRNHYPARGKWLGKDLAGSRRCLVADIREARAVM